MRRSVGGIRCLLALLLLQAATPGSSAAENALKTQARFTAGILHFISWPEESFESDSSPIVIALLGDVPYANELRLQAINKKVGGRSLEIHRVERLDEAPPSHVVIMGSTSRGDQQAVLERLGESPVVTIALSTSFAKLGGTVGMAMRNDRGMFEVNREGAERSGIRIGSRLLRLASAVY